MSGKAQAQVLAWAQEAGLTTRFDQVGNFWAKPKTFPRHRLAYRQPTL
ncbi:MAG: hypothetical protein ABJE99_15120 [Roseobacter sp.]